ncbi:hypothetical protein KP509_01G071900 [Ceratopteris richardii]|uniref:Protein kinase domain-containing protein n=1 Tax=Ceratopteris richardii TaxID=49495 RepID=A0A8T2VME7_CERRI|nr:hypothetical protein KP509_01G071900 [Ceratopteris richardii]
MTEELADSSSWISRTHFSRAVCYRAGGCDPSNTWIRLPSGERSYLAERIKNRHHQSNGKCLDQCQPADGSLQREDSIDQKHADGLLEVREDGRPTNIVDFSFPCPFSPSRISTDGSQYSKESLDCSSPSRQDSEHSHPAQYVNSSSISHNGFLHSVLSSLNISSSRWSTSSDSFHERHGDHSPRSSFKSSLFSWISPKSSPKSSPRVSPAVSPRSSPPGSPRMSFGYSAGTPVKRSNMPRAPSWSDHLSNAGNEVAVPNAENWMIDLSQLLLGDRFATGKHSRVYHGMYKESPVAVKIIRQPDDNSVISDRLEQIFSNEVTTLSILNHHNIIKFVAACRKPPVLCVVTEYLQGGSLRSFLHKREGQCVALDKVLRMALNIAAGMEYLHMKGIMHRDLKSENLVLGEDGVLKILDFGVSCFECHCDYKADDPGTYRWMAPEMLRHEPYTRKVDVYSFGIVLWELLTARVPYEEMSAVQAAFCVLHKDLRPIIPLDCPPSLRDLMTACWSKDPGKRPEFWEIMRELSDIQESLTTQEFPIIESPQRCSSLPSWLQHDEASPR